MAKKEVKSTQYRAEEMDLAASQAVYGLQLSKDKAIRFILRRVKGSDVRQARKALHYVCTSYKTNEPDYGFK